MFKCIYCNKHKQEIKVLPEGIICAECYQNITGRSMYPVDEILSENNITREEVKDNE